MVGLCPLPFQEATTTTAFPAVFLLENFAVCVLLLPTYPCVTCTREMGKTPPGVMLYAAEATALSMNPDL